MILNIFLHYIREISIPLGIGLLLSGTFHEFVSQKWVKEHLAYKGIWPLLWAAGCGILLPLCCLGTLPVVVGLRKKGVNLGPTLTFLVATPSTSIPAILIAIKILGVGFTLYLCLSVVGIALLVGIIGNSLHIEQKKGGMEICPHCKMEIDGNHRHQKRGWINRISSILSFGIDILKEIGPFLILGLIMASFVNAYAPIGDLIRVYLGAGFGYLFALVFGLLMYICPVASIPFVHALIKEGMNIGAGLALLIIGPITCYPAILVIGREFGIRVLSLYLGTICLGALFLGYFFSLI